MPTTIFDWIARTAMLVMAGLVTLSILGAIATMTSDPGTGFAGGDRPLIEADRAEEREAARAPQQPVDRGNAAAAVPAPGGSGTIVAARPAPEDTVARWLEAIAYALLAIAGVGALVVLMLWQAVRELRRIGRSPR
jgi:hypothetical protein